MLPVSPKLILDVVPVDHVASAMLMVAAQAIVEQPKLVFQLSSGDLNPLHMDRVVTLTGLYKRQALPRQGDAATASSTSWRRAWSSARSTQA